MTTRTTLVSVSDGDQLNQGYFNDSFKRVKKFTLTSATEESTTSTSTTNVIKTGTITVDNSDNVPIYISITADIKGYSTDGTVANMNVLVGGVSMFADTESTSNYVTHSKVITNTQLGQQSSYTVDVRFYRSGGSDTVYIKNVTVTVIVVQGPMDTATPAFS